MAGLFMKFLPRRTFEQMIHKFGLRHLNDIEYVMNNIVLKNTKCCTLFPSLGFLSQRVFPSKVLTRHILLSMDTQGEVL